VSFWPWVLGKRRESVACCPKPVVPVLLFTKRAYLSLIYLFASQRVKLEKDRESFSALQVSASQVTERAIVEGLVS